MGDVPEAWLAAYDATLAVLREHDEPLAARVRDWVVDGVGDGRALLGEVHSQATQPIRSMSAGFIHVAVREPLRTVLDGLPALQPELIGRFVTVLAAADTLARTGATSQAATVQYAFLRVVNFAFGEELRAGKEIPFDVAFLERLSLAYQVPTSRLLSDAHKDLARGYSPWAEAAALPLFRGYAGFVRRHKDDMRGLLSLPGVADRLAALKLLASLPDDGLTLFVKEVAEAATSGAVKVRAAAEPLLARCGEAVTGELRGIAGSAKPEARAWALRLLWSGGDAAQRVWCQEQAAADKAGQVRMLVEEWSSLASEAADEPEPEPRPVEFDWREAVSAEDQALLQGFLDSANARRAELDPATVERIVAALAEGRPEELPGPSGQGAHRLYWEWYHATVKPSLGVAATLALLHVSGELVSPYHGVDLTASRELNRWYAETGHPTLGELAAALDDLGADGGKCVLFAWGNGSEWGEPLCERPPEEVAEFALLHLDAVLDQVAPVKREYGVDKRAAHRALATVPVLPARAVDRLYSVALGPRKAERRAAQDLLDRIPGIVTRVVPSLRDSRADLRAEAAAWLGRVGDPAALEPLEQAFAKEKQDLPLAAVLDALKALGQPVEKYLRPEDLAEQARAAVGKGLPKELAWFPWEGLPDVRWRTGEVVPVEVLQWFLSQAVKARSPEPNALLRTYTSMFEPHAREALGQFVLEAWVAEDTATVDPETARRQAEHEASSLEWYFQNTDYYKSHPLYGRAHEEIVAAVIPRHLRTPVGSATSSKGVLAVAAACAGERAAPVVQRYLQQFQALRRAQGQALVAMLAWIAHPSATQLMLSVGSRFRSKSIQAEANKQAQALAERKGWTMAELADRSVPTAGFDDDGVLDLSYGDRAFTAQLLPDLSIELRSPEGKVVKALPSPRVGDDEEAVKESKRALSSTRRELKQVVEHQTARLYEAMCTQRSWEYDVWQRYVLGHPVLRHIAQRLVWSVDDGNGIVLLRPLGDGTLTDVHDSMVAPTGGEVTLAHGSLVAPEEAKAWQEHLTDYEVTPPFTQFGHDYVLPEGQRQETALTEFEGSMLESFTLRGHATKLGYTRGEAGDAAVFTTYEKAFSDCELVAVVNFTGSSLPEQNITVALTGLTFQRPSQRRLVPLGEVPPVLLAEAWHDMSALAGDGPGIDPDWQRKVDYN